MAQVRKIDEHGRVVIFLHTSALSHVLALATHARVIVAWVILQKEEETLADSVPLTVAERRRTHFE